MPRIRTVRTASGATAVQIVWRKHHGSLVLEHVGSAHDAVELSALLQVAHERLHSGEEPLDVGVDSPSTRFRIIGSRSARLWDALLVAWQTLDFDHAVTDRVFRDLVFARVVEPTSKRDTIRVLESIGVSAPSYRTIQNCLDRCEDRGYRASLERACARFVDVSAVRMCLYDVTTLYWETDTPDELRKPGYSKERRLEPQILVGLLTTPTGFPLVVRCFEGNMAETRTLVPVLGTV